jgi:branched-chain amino acid transport system permease protein
MGGIHPVVVIWLVLAGPVWAAIGAWGLPRVYRRKGLDDSQARLVGGLGGLTLGPLLVVPLWYFTPELERWYWGGGPGILAALELYALFAALDPGNLCVTNADYVANQVSNGLVIGFIYALMAVGLTLIYSVQGVISFCHGQFYMLGGYVSYYLLQLVWDVNPIVGVPVAGLATMLVGFVFERLFLRPMHRGQVERAGEYAILITFGFGFFLQYTVLAAVGPFSQKTDPYLGLGSFTLGPLNLIPNRLVAAAVGIVLIGVLLYVLNRTWMGSCCRWRQSADDEHPRLWYWHHAGRYVGCGTDTGLYLGALGRHPRGHPFLRHYRPGRHGLRPRGALWWINHRPGRGARRGLLSRSEQGSCL